MNPRLKESLLWGTGAGGAALLLAAIALTVWQADFTVPLDVGAGDTTLTLISAKGMFENKSWDEDTMVRRLRKELR